MNRKRPAVRPGEPFLPFGPDEDLVPPMALAGEGYGIHVTGLTHDERGYPMIDPETQERRISRMLRKIRDRRAEIVEVEEVELEDARIVLIAYGSTGRAARRALRLARERGLKAGMLRLITPWPFPGERVAELRDIAQAGQLGRAGQTRRSRRPSSWRTHAP